MTLDPGTCLGPYEILSPIGAGGMGEVYKAKDTRLERTVAIKVLPEHFAKDAERRERFEREARAVSSLNHPHICTLHDIGEQDGTGFLVMEYIEGESLADRLKKGALPLDQALRHAIEIADALDKAHRQGVVHRDLKPGNIMLTKSGAKLLDFGLAKLKASGPGQEGSVLSALPTEEKPLTKEGSILGTFQYMAPEQLEGKEADSRTDIFAFGAMLYEMVTGQKAFMGKSQANLISAIMSSEPPPIASTQTLAPPTLDWTVKRCLAKDPDGRWQTARDLRAELSRIGDGVVRDSHPAAQRTNRERLAWSLVVLLSLAAGVLAVWGIGRVSRSIPQPIARFDVSFPQFFGPAGRVTGRRSVAISPDGRHIVYSALSGSTMQLYLRALDQIDAQLIAGLGNSWDPFFSPDSRWLGFSTGNTLKKISLSGGVPVTICDTTGVTNGASWGAGDTIVFATDSGELYRVSAAGGTPQALIVGNADEGTRYRWPEILPDGRTVLVTDWKGINPQTRLAVIDLETGEHKTLISEAGYGSDAPPGHVLFVSLSNETSGPLLAAPFDASRLEIKGLAVPVVEKVYLGAYSSPVYAASSAGTLVYAGGRESRGHLDWVDRQGNVQSDAELPGFYSHPRFSPDGHHVVVSGNNDLWRYDSTRKTVTRLTFEGKNYWPIWSPDGRWIAFTSDRSGIQQTTLLKTPADGSGAAEELLTTGHSIWGTSWSSDGKLLAYSELHPETRFDLWILPLDGEASPYPFLKTPFLERSARFSPDGRFIAYTSNESGRDEIYVRSFPGPGGKWPVSTEGGRQPAWSPTGRELFYRNDDKLMAVQVESGLDFEVGPPRILFTGNYSGGLLIFASYDISPDGERFVLVRGSGPARLQVVLNWHEELKRLAPTN